MICKTNSVIKKQAPINRVGISDNAKPAQYAFRAENFTQIPNFILNLALEGKLIARDIIVYAYLLGKSDIAKLRFNNDYTMVSQAIMSKELKLSLTTVKASLRRLRMHKIIEQKDTPGFTRKRILVLVVEGRTVSVEPCYGHPVNEEAEDPFAAPQQWEQDGNLAIEEVDFRPWEDGNEAVH